MAGNGQRDSRVLGGAGVRAGVSGDVGRPARSAMAMSSSCRAGGERAGSGVVRGVPACQGLCRSRPTSARRAGFVGARPLRAVKSAHWAEERRRTPDMALVRTAVTTERFVRAHPARSLR